MVNREIGRHILKIKRDVGRVVHDHSSKTKINKTTHTSPKSKTIIKRKEITDCNKSGKSIQVTGRPNRENT